MIFPLMVTESKTITFDGRLTVFDKHIYACLCRLSQTSGFRIKDLLSIIGNNVDEGAFYHSIQKLENLGYVFIENVKDENNGHIYTCVGDTKSFPKFSTKKLKAFKFLDSKDLFRNVSFYALSKRILVRRQKSYAGTRFPLVNTRGFDAYKTKENSLLFYFGRKVIGEFEKPEESLEELKYCGISIKKFTKFLIDKMGKVGLQLSEEAPLTSFRTYLKTAPESIRYAFAIFFEGCVFLAKDSDTPEQFKKIILGLSKSKIRMIKEKEKKKSLVIVPNPKIPVNLSSVVDYWNTKNLVKHKDYNKKVVINACKIMAKLQKGTFGKIEGQFTTEDFCAAIDAFDVMANDPDVKPTGLKQKQILKKTSIEDFFYSKFNGRSRFTDIMELGVQTLIQPYSEEVFQQICISTQRITNTKLTSNNKNHLALFLNSVKSFFDSNRPRFEYEATVIKICIAIIRSLTKNGKFLNYKFLISEEMRLNHILKVCLEEGFIIGVRRQADSVVYKKVNR